MSVAGITFDDFMKIDMRVGRVVGIRDFPEARKPAYILEIDFGEEVGVKNTSAQVTRLYRKEELLGRQVIAVLNFPPKQIGGFMSEVLVLGALCDGGRVILLQPEREAPLGSRVG